MARAWSNLRLAQIGKQAEVFLEDLCFEAQQAAEKALKALCLHHGIDFPKTHSLVYLMDLLESRGVKIPEEVREADLLTQYAVTGRYPGWLSVTEEEYAQALDLAQRVVLWVEEQLRGGGKSDEGSGSGTKGV